LLRVVPAPVAEPVERRSRVLLQAALGAALLCWRSLAARVTLLVALRSVWFRAPRGRRLIRLPRDRRPAQVIAFPGPRAAAR
jgi:hypothetical protein